VLLSYIFTGSKLFLMRPHYDNIMVMTQDRARTLEVDKGTIHLNRETNRILYLGEEIEEPELMYWSVSAM